MIWPTWAQMIENIIFTLVTLEEPSKQDRKIDRFRSDWQWRQSKSLWDKLVILVFINNADVSCRYWASSHCHSRVNTAAANKSHKAKEFDWGVQTQKLWIELGLGNFAYEKPLLQLFKPKYWSLLQGLQLCFVPSPCSKCSLFKLFPLGINKAF